MGYQQIKPFNQAQAGTRPNWCLDNVTKGYGIKNYYDSAWEAWKHTEQHSGDAPMGLDVPVYFSYSATIDGEYRNWGHIGVRLANGKFWSDGKIYNSVSEYTTSHSPKYVGWGESVNNVKVIKEGGTMPLDPADQALKDIGLQYKEAISKLPKATQDAIGGSPLGLTNVVLSLEDTKKAWESAEPFKQVIVKSPAWNQTGDLNALDIVLKGQGGGLPSELNINGKKYKES